jgi:hypothetical protein
MMQAKKPKKINTMASNLKPFSVPAGRSGDSVLAQRMVHEEAKRRKGGKNK